MKNSPIIYQIWISIPITLYCNCLVFSTETNSNLTPGVTYSAGITDANRKTGSNGDGDKLNQDNSTPISVQRQNIGRDKIDLSYSKSHCPFDSIEVLEKLCPQMLQQLLNTAFDDKKTTAQEPRLTNLGIPFALKLQANQNGSETLQNTTAGLEESPEVATWKKYLYGSLSILVISLCSLLGAAFMKVTGAAMKSYMMAAMLSLAVGCLVSDVALELLPETISVETDSEIEGAILPGNVIKMTAFLGSVYAFFLLELILSKHHSHSHGIDSQLSKNNIGSDRSSDDSLPSSADWAVDSAVSATSINMTKSQDKTEQVEMHSLGQFESQSSNSSHTEGQDTENKPKTIAWMIILGDGIHNFADGIAIGAAYSVSFSTGLSTSVTVLCHEVPHELGDFAVLVSTGLSIKKAMVLNFLSSLTAFVGLYIGLSIGNQEEASKWIFSTAAGMFLYVAMTNLIPECKEYYQKTPTVKMFIFENLGLLCGYGVMLVLTIFEDKMTI